MSESNEHRFLIKAMMTFVRRKYKDYYLILDIQDHPGSGCPPLIGQFRPDIFAEDIEKKHNIICEAKTSMDLETHHSLSQIKAFLMYLELKGGGVFILGIFGQKADRAKTILRFMVGDGLVRNTLLMVYDGCDYWELRYGEELKWRLI